MFLACYNCYLICKVFVTKLVYSYLLGLLMGREELLIVVLLLVVSSLMSTILSGFLMQIIEAQNANEGLRRLK